MTIKDFLSKSKDDLTGRKYGGYNFQILVIGSAGDNKWLCVRNNEVVILTESHLREQFEIPLLRKFWRQGRYPREDLVGKRFNTWEVLKYAGRDENGGAIWLCRCHGCGSLVQVYTKNLKSGRSKSCGNCLRKLKQRYLDLISTDTQQHMNDYVFSLLFKIECDDQMQLLYLDQALLKYSQQWSGRENA